MNNIYDNIVNNVNNRVLKKDFRGSNSYGITWWIKPLCGLT
jgi:hypothetical protein